jgi:hypothetical protein
MWITIDEEGKQKIILSNILAFGIQDWNVTGVWSVEPGLFCSPPSKNCETKCHNYPVGGHFP